MKNLLWGVAFLLSLGGMVGSAGAITFLSVKVLQMQPLLDEWNTVWAIFALMVFMLVCAGWTDSIRHHTRGR